MIFSLLLLSLSMIVVVSFGITRMGFVYNSITLTSITFDQSTLILIFLGYHFISRDIIREPTFIFPSFALRIRCQSRIPK